MSLVENLFEQTKTALRDSKPSEAAEFAAKALILSPDDMRLVLLRGVALRRSGNSLEAESYLRRIINEQSSVPLAHHELGLALSAMGRLAEGIASVESAVALDPNLLAAWRDLYQLHAAQGDDRLPPMPIAARWAERTWIRY